MAAQQYVLLREWQRLARGDPQLQLDEVDARDELGDRVLDLKPRVHLHEEEELVGGVARHDELDRPGAEVADAPRRLARGLADARARRVVGKRRRRLLDDLLMAALQRALALPEVHDVPVRVSEDLHFDVSGRRHVPLEKEGVVAEGCRGLAPRRRDRVCELSLGLDDMHPLSGAARRRFDEHGEADLGRPRDELFVGEARAREPRNGRHAALFDRLLRRDLVAHDLDRLGARADEDDSRVDARAREGSVLGEKAEARVDRIGARSTRGLEHALDREVALRRGGGPEPDGLVGEAHVHSSGIRIAKNSDGTDAEASQRPDDPHRDLAAVRDACLRAVRRRTAPSVRFRNGRTVDRGTRIPRHSRMRNPRRRAPGACLHRAHDH